MRVLFTHAGGSGHSDPLVPIAEAMVSAGHVVTETLGYERLADTEDADTPHEIAPLRALDMAHQGAQVHLGRIGPARHASG